MRNILLIFLFAVGFNTFAQDKSVQFTGILVSTDSLLTIPFANILIKNNKKGTISDFYGYFSLVANKGDTIITNSHSIVFPEGISIGTITSFKKDTEGYYNVEVTFFEDFNQLNFVYIINSTETEEQQNLEAQVKDE